MSNAIEETLSTFNLYSKEKQKKWAVEKKYRQP